MPYPRQCFSTQCNFQCCDINGYCPSTKNGCEYYYDEQYEEPLSDAAIAAIAVGAICLFTMFVVVICFLLKRCYKRRLKSLVTQKNAPIKQKENLINDIIQEHTSVTTSLQDLNTYQGPSFGNIPSIQEIPFPNQPKTIVTKQTN